MVIKTAISLKKEVHAKGMNKATILFSGNFSAYVGYLISKDCYEEVIKVRKEVTGTIDHILNI